LGKQKKIERESIFPPNKFQYFAQKMTTPFWGKKFPIQKFLPLLIPFENKNSPKMKVFSLTFFAQAIFGWK
jgi:hypothetical protein